MLTDRFNREHTYLRISLTDHCNLRCSYCMPDEDMVFAPADRLMQKDEIISLARIFVEEGVNRIRLTGGEPLVRKDAAEILLSLAELPVSLNITTNATRVHDFIGVLKQAGIQTVNISLDTLDRELFHIITKRNYFDLVQNNIALLLANSFTVKINVVIMKGINDREILDFVHWTRSEPIHVRFIEFMPFDGNRWDSDKVFTWDEMLRVIEENHTVTRLPDGKHDTAKAYGIAGYTGTFSVITTMSAPFCGTCNRMRLTADGKMKNCLFSTHESDLLSVLRSGEDVRPVIRQCIAGKEERLGGQLDMPFREIETSLLTNRTMISIGG